MKRKVILGLLVLLLAAVFIGCGDTPAGPPPVVDIWTEVTDWSTANGTWSFDTFSGHIQEAVVLNQAIAGIVTTLRTDVKSRLVVNIGNEKIERQTISRLTSVLGEESYEGLRESSWNKFKEDWVPTVLQYISHEFNDENFSGVIITGPDYYNNRALVSVSINQFSNKLLWKDGSLGLYGSGNGDVVLTKMP